MRATATHLHHLLRLPPRVAAFYGRALLTARRTGDAWSLEVASRPPELRALLRALAGRRRVAEIGTAAAWTTAALALAEPDRTVVSYDVEIHPQRERYLALLGPTTRARILLRERPGGQGPESPPTVDGLFVDGDHDRAAVRGDFELWEPVLTPGGVVCFHDYGDPAFAGVAEAVSGLGLSGEVHRRLFVWHKS